MVYRVPLIAAVIATLMLAVPASAQGMDGVPPSPRSNSEYPRAEGPPPFAERTHNQMVPLRVNPARLDAQSRTLLERFDVQLQPYRILSTRGGTINITTGPRADIHNNVTRVGTTFQICNRDVLHHHPFTNSRGAESWPSQAPGSHIPGNLAPIAPGRCFTITPDRPGVIWMNCEYHRNEIYAIIVLPADHDLSDESVQQVLLRLSGGRSGEYATFTPRPGYESGRGKVGFVPNFQWDTRIRVHGIECFGGKHYKVYFDHYHYKGRFVGADRREYDRVRGEGLATGKPFCGAWETKRETLTQ